MTYQASLDGVRALAVVAVVVFHVAPSRLPGGFIGVDVFFVLSGFLITSLIADGVRQGQFSLREFYLRRVLRLAPNMLVMLAAVLLMCHWLALPSFGRAAREHVLWVLGCVSNWFTYTQVGGYWGTDAASAPFLHTWSLAVEEQFYFVYPAVLMGLLGVGSRFARLLILGLVVASWLACWWATSHEPKAAFYLAHMRVWELLAGAYLALRPVVGLSRKMGHVAGALGSMMILAGYLGISNSGGFPGSVAWVPAGGTLLVLAGVSRADSWSAKLLSHPAAVVIGKMSYSIYLWHWPAIVLARHYAELHDLGTRRSASVVGMLAGVGLAWVAYRWIEAPMRMGAVHRSKKIILLGGGFVGVLVLAQGLPSSASTTGQAHLNFSPLVFRGMEFSLAPEAGAFASLATRYRDVEFPFVKLAETQVWLNGGILKPHGGTNAPKVVVFGSSHALMYGGEIDDLCRERSWTAAYFCADGVSPLYPTQTCELLPTAEAVRGFDRARLGWLTRWHPEWLVVVDRWDRFGSLADFESQVRALLEAVRGKVGQVLFISQVPVLRLGEAVNLREYARWNYQRSGQMPEISADQRAARRQQQRELLRRIVQECPYARLLDPGPFFEQAGGRVRYYEGDKFFYADDDHLSQFGSSLIRPLLEQHFGALPSKKVLN